MTATVSVTDCPASAGFGETVRVVVLATLVGALTICVSEAEPLEKLPVGT